MKKTIAVIFIFLTFAGPALADELAIGMRMVDDRGVGKEIGTVTVMDSRYGLILIPDLSDLPSGIHGFHVHQHPDCSHAVMGGKSGAALAAGGHYDPLNTGSHEGPYGRGHLGDLPALYVGGDGKASLPILAPRLRVGDLKGRSLMIHAGGDNYADAPEKLGGGGERIACGVIR